MTTTILSVSKERRLVISDGKETSVHFSHEDSYGDCIAMLNVDRQQLIAALHAELGVLIIDKAPQIDVHEQDGVAYARTAMEGIVDSRPMGARPADLRVHGLAMLALADFIEADPIDEESVATLANILEGVTGGCTDGWDWADVARQAIRSGRVEVQS